MLQKIEIVAPDLVTGNIFTGNIQPGDVDTILRQQAFLHLGCQGQAKIETPHLDRMAAEGMRFEAGYAGRTVCAPSPCNYSQGVC